MEEESKKTEIDSENILSEGENPDRNMQYVSPEVAAAQSGEVVEFTMDVNAGGEDSETEV